MTSSILMGLPRNAEAFDFPFKLDSAGLFHPRAHRLAERLEIGAACIPLVDEKVAVHLRDLSVADGKSTAASRVDELPGLVLRRVLEGRAAGATLDRLHLLAIGGNV